MSNNRLVLAAVVAAVALFGLVVWTGNVLKRIKPAPAAADPEPAAPSAANPPPVPWGTPAPLGGLRVVAETAEVGPANVFTPGVGVVGADGTYLLVGVAVSCPDPAAAPAFGPGPPGAGGYTADVRDGFGNVYRLVRFRSPVVDTRRPRGLEGVPQLTGVVPVRAGTPVNDLLVFDPPAPAAGDLVLTVRTAADAAALAIPAAKWKRP